MPDRRHIVVIYTDAGGGHRATAEALQDILGKDRRFRVTLVNAYTRVLPKQDLFARWTSRNVEQTYNDLVLRDGRTGLFCLGFYLLAVLNVRIMWHQGRRAFKAVWQDLRPDLVVSVLPLINQLMIESLRDADGDPVPLAVLITDWQEMSRAVWFPRNGNYHAICGTDASLRQIENKRHPPEKTFRTTGLLIRPAFLDPPPSDIAKTRQALGLDPALPVACMLYGGGGSWRMLNLAESLLPEPPDIQIIFLCGRDAALADALRARGWPFPTVVEGFTPAVHTYLGVADIFVGKPGPASVSEAYALGLRLLLDRHLMLPQERPILRWVERQQAGQSFKTVEQFRCALTDLAATRPPRSGATASAAGRNAAAREIPDVVAAILGQTSAPDASHEPGGENRNPRGEVQEGHAGKVVMP